MDSPTSCRRTEFDMISSPCASKTSASVPSSSYDDEDQCRICRTGIEVDVLISPCDCKGSIQFVHPQCLVKWITYTGRTSHSPSQNKRCELCGMAYQLVWSARPWRRWKLPQLNHSERLRLHVFTFSYLLAAIDIGYSVRWFFLPVLYNHLSKPAILVKCLWLLLTTASWIYIFSMHSRFFYMLWRKWMEQNMDLTIKPARK